MTSGLRSHTIASIPGDGIGPETVAAARRVLDAVAANAGFGLAWQEYPWGCDHYLATGSMMDEDGLAALSKADAILLGAVGRPDVPDHVSLWGLLIPIRRGFDQFVSLRPVRLLEGVDSPLAAGRNELDVVIVRENTEGEYPDVELTRYHVDALAALLVLDPARFDVVLGSNLFGDILSDLTAALAGSIGIAPCGNIDPTRRFPSMFEPIHGSAPDIVGRGIANPIGQIWSSVLMLEHLGEADAARRLERAIESVLAAGIRTPDLGGSHDTSEVTDAVIAAYEQSGTQA